MASGTTGFAEHESLWTPADEYAFAQLHPSTSTFPSNDVLSHALANSKSQGLPEIAVSPTQGKFLKIQAQLLKAKNVLELGTLGGYSTIWLASASPETKVISIEVDAHHAEVARANIAHAGLSDQVEVRLGAGLEVLPQIAEEVKQGKKGKFQLIFIDADKQNNWNYVDAAIGMCDPGACIIVDNVVRKGQLAWPSEDPKVQGSRKVVEMLGKDERIDGTVVQTVGEKGYDGFLLAIVR